jgi:hypothetical protein
MAKKPPNFEWLGFSEEQIKLLNFLDFLGNNGWAVNPHASEMMPKVLAQCSVAGLSLADIKTAMAVIGYHEDALHQLDRWESKRTTGRLGR